MPHTPASQALSRFRVLDLTRVRAGPTCARQLADWGADVIKIEAPAKPGQEQLGGDRNGPDFQNLHRNKRSLTLNLRDTKGHAIFMELVDRADVVIENYRPDVKNRLKIDYEALKSRNPRIILASISGFGQDGPYRERPGFDQIAQGMGGLMWITGIPGHGPVRAGIPIADLSAGLLAANGILTALLEREISGEGQWVQSSLLQAQIFMLDFQAARWLMAGEVAGQAGNNHPTSIPTGVFETTDGLINIATAGGEIWERFAQAIEAPELVEDPRFKDAASRSKNRDILSDEINQRLRAHSSADWIKRLNAASVPCGTINKMDEVFADPQVTHLRMARSGPSHLQTRADYVSQGVELSRSQWEVAAPPPRAGEHSDEVLQWLGHDASEIARLREEGVI